jgi:alpha/beta superfamily hydrolase
MIENRVRFPCGDLSLEGVSAVPDSKGPFPGVVVCHPHPLYGGEMNNNVVVPICVALAQASIVSLRFNFRGVGASQGKFADGIGEREDVTAAISYLSTLEAVDKERIGLCGYSFGGAISLEVAPADERLKALALVSPEISTYVPLKQYTKPKLIVCGGADQFVSIISLQRLAEELPPPNDFELISGADHFWAGYEDKVAARVAAFFVNAFRPPPPEVKPSSSETV